MIYLCLENFKTIVNNSILKKHFIITIKYNKLIFNIIKILYKFYFIKIFYKINVINKLYIIFELNLLKKIFILNKKFNINKKSIYMYKFFVISTNKGLDIKSKNFIIKNKFYKNILIVIN